MPRIATPSRYAAKTGPERVAIIRRAIEKGRRSWAAYLQLQNEHIYNVLSAMADDIARQIARAERDGLIPPYRQQAILEEVREQMKVLRTSLSSSITRGISNSVDHGLKTMILAMDAAGIAKQIQIGTSFIDAAGVVRKFQATKETFLQSAWARINREAVDAVLKWQPNGLAFSERVWEITRTTQKGLLDSIRLGVYQGRSAASISRDIRHYLALPDTFRGKALKDYHPGRGVYKSAYQNAMRLARTELNRAFVEGTIRYAQTKTWIDGYVWRRGSLAACPTGICDDGADQFYAKGDEPFLPAHPNCLCRLDLHIEGDPVE